MAITYELLGSSSETPADVAVTPFGAWTRMTPPTWEKNPDAVWYSRTSEVTGRPITKRYLQGVATVVHPLFMHEREVNGGWQWRIEITSEYDVTDSATDVTKYSAIRFGFDIASASGTIPDTTEAMQMYISAAAEMFGTITAKVPANTVLDAFNNRQLELGA